MTIVLAKALPKWNPAKGRFTTYASYWIFAAVMAYGQKHCHAKAVSSAFIRHRRALRRASEEIALETGGVVDKDEAAARAGLSQEWMDLLATAEAGNISIDAAENGARAREETQAYRHVRSLPADTEDPVASQAATELLTAIREYLTEEQQRLLHYRFWEGLSLREVGMEYKEGRTVGRETTRKEETEILGILCIALGIPDTFPIFD